MTNQKSIELYRPSNGSEGECFMAEWCSCCEHEWYSEEEGCDILGNTMAFDIDDPNYPNEWRYNSEGKPICTAFQLKEGGWQETYRCPYTIDMFRGN